jgi:hypothetical protein
VLQLIAPPGIPVQRPERGMLGRWRSALWQDGEISSEVIELDNAELFELAGSNRLWIEEKNLSAQRRELAIRKVDLDKPQISYPGVDLHAELTLLDRRPALAVTQSASTYAALVVAQPPDTPIARVERLAGRKMSISEMGKRLADVANVVGVDQTRELVVALLHARARSHSWRYTKPLRVFERSDPLERTVEREIDSAKTGVEVLQRLRTVELQVRELDILLVTILHKRARSPRWLITSPLRRVLGAPKLVALRRLLRNARAGAPDQIPALPPARSG